MDKMNIFEVKDIYGVELAITGVAGVLHMLHNAETAGADRNTHAVNAPAFWLMAEILDASERLLSDNECVISRAMEKGDAQ